MGMYRVLSLVQWVGYPLLTVCWALISVSVAAQSGGPEHGFEQATAALVGAKLKQMPQHLQRIEDSADPRRRGLYQAWLKGRLYWLKQTQQLVVVEPVDQAYTLSDPLEESTWSAPVAKSAIKKVKSNNRLRSRLRLLLAQLDLNDETLAVRLSAAEALLADLTPQHLQLLRQRLERESEPKMQALLSIALHLQQLQDPRQSLSARETALQSLQGELRPVVRNQLQAVLSQWQAATALTPDQQALQPQLQATLTDIEDRVAAYRTLERLFFGLSLGSVLLLAAIGLAITFGVMGVINMAHGEMIMLGAYTTFVIQQWLPQWVEYSLLLALPSAFLVAGGVGILVERGVIRFLRGRPLETLLATFGVSLLLQQLVRTLFSPLNQTVITPSWLSGAWQINPVLSLTYNRLYIILFSLLIFALLLLVLKRTALGLYVRAVAQNRTMARAMGVRSEWVDALTFGLGSGVAGVAGVALSQLTNVGPNLGQSYIIDSFLVVVFGGVGNLWGTLVGAFSLGVLNKFLEPVTGTVLASILVLVAIILFIQRWPRGLFPQQGRGEE